MCIIGCLFDKDGKIHTFKQCDLTKKAEFQKPQIEISNAGIRYLPMRRTNPDKTITTWAGINEHGLSFTAADAYTKKEYKLTDDQKRALFDAYDRIISSHRNAKEAAAFILMFYQKKFPAPDLIQIADPKECITIEYSPEIAEIITTKRGHCIYTNHFRKIAVRIEENSNPSTYIRLKRAEEIITKTPDKKGIENTLKDESEGKTELSICRTAKKPGEFYTQASVIFTIDKGKISCSYVINSNPKKTSFTTIKDIFNSQNK